MKKGIAAFAFLISALLLLTVDCGSNFQADCENGSQSFPVTQLIDANGVLTYGIVPPGYRPGVASPWVLYNHGSGQSGRDISTNRHDRCLVNPLVQAGYVVIASDYNVQNCWGNSQCDTDIAAVQERWKGYLNLRAAPYVIAESMGGIVTWNAIAHGTLSPLAVVGIYPACSLSNMYAGGTGPFYPVIQSDYDFSSPSGYATATAGYDPMLDPPSDFTAFPILLWASYSDTTVVRSHNENPFAFQVNAAGGNVIVNTSTGNHGDVSNFDPQAVLEFFEAH